MGFISLCIIFILLGFMIYSMDMITKMDTDIKYIKSILDKK